MLYSIYFFILLDIFLFPLILNPIVKEKLVGTWENLYLEKYISIF